MRILHCTFVAVVFIAHSATVHGDTFIRRLPADGAWARFYVNESWSDGAGRTMWITISSAGKAMVGNKKCRWIEWKFQTEDAPQRETASVFKFLIPEEHLKAGGDPLANVVKAWRRTRDRELVEMGKNDVEALLPRLHLVCEGPPIQQIQKIGGKETIEWQSGKLECEVLLGNTREESVEVHYRLRVHPKVPFGVAAATLEVEDHDFAETGTLDFALTEMGTGAKSALPAAN